MQWHTGTTHFPADCMDLDGCDGDGVFVCLCVAALNDMNLLRTGSHRHEITDHNVCKTQTTHDHQLVESMVAKKYHAQNVLHGLVGQTWRNVKVCGRDWMGQVEDYLVADGLFGTCKSGMGMSVSLSLSLALSLALSLPLPILLSCVL